MCIGLRVNPQNELLLRRRWKQVEAGGQTPPTPTATRGNPPLPTPTCLLPGDFDLAPPSEQRRKPPPTAKRMLSSNDRMSDLSVNSNNNPFNTMDMRV